MDNWFYVLIFEKILVPMTYPPEGFIYENLK